MISVEFFQCRVGEISKRTADHIFDTSGVCKDFQDEFRSAESAAWIHCARIALDTTLGTGHEKRDVFLSIATFLHICIHGRFQLSRDGGKRKREKMTFLSGGGGESSCLVHNLRGVICVPRCF